MVRGAFGAVPAGRQEVPGGDAPHTADLDWTREDWRFLAKRNASAILTTAEGREVYQREFQDALLLMDTRKATAGQEDGADRYNAQRLERLAREKDVPILSTRAPQAAQGLRA